VPKDIPIRLRRIVVQHVGSKWKRIMPDDRPTDEYDLDFTDLIMEVELEFGISIPDEVIQGLDGSFDSIVQYLAKTRRENGGKRAGSGWRLPPIPPTDPDVPN
jgi:acyl carrier protein